MNIGERMNEWKNDSIVFYLYYFRGTNVDVRDLPILLIYLLQLKYLHSSPAKKGKWPTKRTKPDSRYDERKREGRIKGTW